MKRTEPTIKNLPKQGFCGECDNHVDFHVELFKNKVHNVKGIEIISDEYVAVCNHCGNHLWVDAVEAYNDIIIFDEYKKKVGLLTTEEIKAIRKKRGMSQRELAKFLSIGEKDIARYENGAIQTRAIDLMIRMVDDDQTFKKMSQVVAKVKLIASKVTS